MKNLLWPSTFKIYLLSVLYFAIEISYWHYHAPEMVYYKSIMLATTFILGLVLFIFLKNPNRRVIEAFYYIEIIVILASFTINHDYFVRNFETFQPLLGVKILAFTIALTTPSKLPGWLSYLTILVVPLVQYYNWPPIYRSQFGAQEPTLTILTILVGAAVYSNRLYINELIRKDAITSEKIAILQRLGSLTTGLQHLNNTPLQTIELSIDLLKKNSPESLSIIESLERSYHSIRRVNNLLSLSSSTMKDSASTVEEFKEDIDEIKKYLSE